MFSALSGFLEEKVKTLVFLEVVAFGTVMLLAAIVLNQLNIRPASAAGGPNMYATFSGDANGLVEVAEYGSGMGSQVTARIRRPDSGIVGFCLTRQDGSRACSTANPTLSSFDKSTKGCAAFTISFNPAELPTRVEVFDENFVTSLARAELTSTAPANLGKLNPCR